MELARIVADTVPPEASQSPPVRRPPVLIAPRRPVTPNMRPLPSERAAAAARAAAEVAPATDPTQTELVATAIEPSEDSAPAEVTTPAAPAPEPERELDEFEKALSAELGAAPLRAPTETAPRAAPARPTAPPRSTTATVRAETRSRAEGAADVRSQVPASQVPASQIPASQVPVSQLPAEHEGTAEPERTASTIAAEEPMARQTSAPPLPPRPTVEDFAAALSLELDVSAEPTVARAAPTVARQDTPPAPVRDGSRPVVQSATNVWLAELPALELPPPDEADASVSAGDAEDGPDDRARRMAEREQRREQRRAARAQRRGAEDGEEAASAPLPAAGSKAGTAGEGAAAGAATPLGDSRPAGEVKPIGVVRPAAASRPGAAPFDFDAFEAEIRSSLDDGPLPEPARPAAPRVEAPAAPAAPAKPAIPKSTGLAPVSVPGRPGEPPAVAAAPLSPPVVAPPASAAPLAAAPRAPQPKVQPEPDDGFDLDLLEASQPVLSDDDVLPPHSDAEQRALRTAMRGRRRTPVVAIAAAAAVVLLAGGATAWWLLSSDTADGPPPLIQAEIDPVKIDPPVADTREAGEPGKAFTDRVSEAGDPARQVLDPEGRQTIDLPIAGREPGDPSLPGVDTDDPLARLSADPNAPVETAAPEPAAEMQPKRVRTVIVRPDGTIVPQQDLPTSVTPTPQAPPSAGLATDPATATAEPGGFAPGTNATTAPGAAPIPTLEPLAGAPDSLAGAIGYPMPRRKPLVFDEPSSASTVARPTSNLPDPLPAAAGAEATPVFGSTQGVNTAATETPTVTAPAPSGDDSASAASATDAAAAALARGTTTADPAPAAPAAVPTPTVAAPEPVALEPVTPEPVAAETAPLPAEDTASVDTRAVTTTPIRVATPAARQDPPPPAAVEPPLSLPSVTPEPATAAPAAQPAAPSAAAAPSTAAGRSARLLPPAGAGTNPFAPSTAQPAAAAAAPPPPAAEPAPAPAPAAVAPAATTTAGGAYAVQLASQKSDAEARAAYAALQRRFPSILGGLSPVIQTADVGTRGTFYRVRLPFGSSGDANRLCNDLKAAGGDCFVGRN